MKTFFAVLCFIAAMAGVANAHSYQQGNIRIGHVWTRATPLGAATAAIYMPLLNTGSEEDKLIGVSSNLASKIEIHESVNEDGVVKMKKIDDLVLVSQKPIALKPQGIHLMVFGLKQQLKLGEKLPITLQFEKAGSIQVDATIEAAGAAAPGH